MIDQHQMKICAFNQAYVRAQREGKRCYVYKRENHPDPNVTTWYVRTEEEGIPEGAKKVGEGKDVIVCLDL